MEVSLNWADEIGAYGVSYWDLSLTLTENDDNAKKQQALLKAISGQALFLTFSLLCKTGRWIFVYLIASLLSFAAE